MTDQYRTVRQEGRFELSDRGSRFIGLCRPIKTEEDALRLISDARVLYPEARHYVYAWRSNYLTKLQRFTDDGEPKGTAGRQVLDALVSQSIDRAAIVVVRYFGGVLLGTGGLTRAYSRSARGAVEAAIPIQFIRCESFLLETDYAVYHQLEGRLETAKFYLESPEYGERVRQIVGATTDRVDALTALIMDVSAGTALLRPEGERWIETRLEQEAADSDV